MHYSAALQYCLVTYLLAQIFCFLFVLKNNRSIMITERFCHCDCWRINDNWTNTHCWIYLIFCILWILHTVWKRGGFLLLIHLRIRKKNFAWIFFFFFGKINSNKFKQVKSQEENNGISKEQSKTVCSCTKREKWTCHFARFFFTVAEKKQVVP